MENFASDMEGVGVLNLTRLEGAAPAARSPGGSDFVPGRMQHGS
jgi:hypothetical protein